MDSGSTVKVVEKLLCGKAYVVIDSKLALPFVRSNLHEYAQQFGEISSRDGGDTIWAVKPRKNKGTFSETDGEARFHTDSQYHTDPERFFILACERPSCDGGETNVITASHAKQVAIEMLGEDAYRRLCAPVWSWEVPDVFCKIGLPKVCPKTSVFQSNGSIRWRIDNLICDNDEDFALAHAFADALEKSECLDEMLLQPGQILIADNWYAMHARKHFTDPQRLYYRIRFNPSSTQ
jgi:alpha-ketoglutarate-dependent taurine dioxygenase